MRNRSSHRGREEDMSSSVGYVHICGSGKKESAPLTAVFAPLSRNSSQAGVLGGWIVRHLLERGEHPKQIRVLDIRAPTRPDLTTGLAKDIDFRLVDISDREQVQAAFDAPWPLAEPGHDQDRGPIDNDSDLNSRRDEDPIAPELSADITVFHTAANIRFYERDPRLLHLSDKVNVEGTQNVLEAARAAGVSVLIYTSSASVAVRRTRLWLWPWEKRPAFWVQTLEDDDDGRLPRRHEEMFSNYAASKIKAERLVRGRPDPAGGIRGEEGESRARARTRTSSYGVSQTGERDLRYWWRHSVRRVPRAAGKSLVGPGHPPEFHLRGERIPRSFL